MGAGAALTDLFVSYKSEDRARVAPLVATLKAVGVGVWWDAHIGGGSSWRQTIEDELTAARCVVVVWSERSVGREGSFFADEATRALRRGAYLPVRIDPVEPPLGFGETQALSLIGWRGDRGDLNYRALLAAIRAVIANAAAAPSSGARCGPTPPHSVHASRATDGRPAATGCTGSTRRARRCRRTIVQEVVMDRRFFILGAAGTLVAAGARPSPLLDRAIRHAGGAMALRRARVLRWQGEATVFAGTRRIEIGVATTVVPFGSARSDSWLLSDGPGRTRSLIITPDGGWIERDGKRTPMPAAMLRHERAQYALYGLMRLVDLTDPGASAIAGGAPGTLLARHPGAPDTLFGVDPDGRLAWATNNVPAPEGSGSIDQRFTFSGAVQDAGVRWPARIEIAQAGAPYFDLRLSRFEVER